MDLETVKHWAGYFLLGLVFIMGYLMGVGRLLLQLLGWPIGIIESRLIPLIGLACLVFFCICWAILALEDNT